MTRAALLQLPGDPFVASYWARNFATWRHEVDALYVLVNGQTDAEAVDFIEDTLRAVAPGKLVFGSQEGRLVHGQATRELVQACDEDLVMLIEDDAFVRDPSQVSQAFDKIEYGHCDVIGSPRGGMSPEVERAAVARWGSFEHANAGAGPGLWPCFLFARTKDLLDTSRIFESRSWGSGHVIPGLGQSFEREVTTDTFTTTAFELRNAGARVDFCVQHKELWHKELPPEGAPWFHAGGLSNGWFLGSWDGGGARPGLAGTNEGNDWAHRCWWWHRIAIAETTGDCEYLLAQQNEYLDKLEQLIGLMGVAEEVDAWTATLLPWINWDDWAH